MSGTLFWLLYCNWLSLEENPFMVLRAHNGRVSCGRIRVHLYDYMCKGGMN